jgi:hypothetical protein
MTHILSTLKKSGRAAVVALTLGAATVTVMPAPAMAQSPSFSFQLGIGGGDPGMTFRFGDDDQRVRVCLTNSQIRRGLRQEGFRNVDIVRELRRNRVEVIASYGRSWYRLTVNRCTGAVRIVERLRRGTLGNSFGLQFNFGM